MKSIVGELRADIDAHAIPLREIGVAVSRALLHASLGQVIRIHLKISLAVCIRSWAVRSALPAVDCNLGPGEVGTVTRLYTFVGDVLSKELGRIGRAYLDTLIELGICV